MQTGVCADTSPPNTGGLGKEVTWRGVGGWGLGGEFSSIIELSYWYFAERRWNFRGGGGGVGKLGVKCFHQRAP